MANTGSDQVLHEWLEMTRFHDVNYRKKMLAQHRALKAIEQQEAALAAEKAKIKRRLETQDDFDDAVGSQAVQSAKKFSPSTNRLTQHLSGAEESFVSGFPQGDDDLSVIETSRGVEGANFSRPQSRHAEINEQNSEFDKDNRYSSSSRGRYKPRPRSRSPAHNILDSDAFTERRGYRGDRILREIPLKLDLGKAGDTRYFTIRSYNVDNIWACHNDGLWATSLENAEVLMKAYEECKNVVLFYSTNRSHAYQGYARMISSPSPDNPRPEWYEKIRWPLCEPFSVEWIAKSTVGHYHFDRLHNRLNEHLPVTRARDCQEIDDYCGRHMVHIMNKEAMRAN